MSAIEVVDVEAGEPRPLHIDAMQVPPGWAFTAEHRGKIFIRYTRLSDGWTDETSTKKEVADRDVPLKLAVVLAMTRMVIQVGFVGGAA